MTEIVEGLKVGEEVELMVAGENLEGDYSSKTVRLPFDDRAKTAEERISSMGLMLNNENGRMLVEYGRIW